MRRSSPLLATLTLALAVASGGCSQQQAPFDPAGDCPKLEYCGQCASHGACAWCGDPADSSKGQCVAVGRSECSAPAAWSKTPEVCPAPTAAVPAAKPMATSSTDSQQKQAIGAEKYEGLRRGLRKAFPHSDVNDTVLDGIVQLMLREHKPFEREHKEHEKAPIAKHVQEKDHKLYMGAADHHRVKGMPPEAKPMQSEFVMYLPMVRVTLPAKIDGEHPIIDTEIGDVDLSRDHLLGSVEMVAEKYADAKHLGYRPARVDLITPARFQHARFGAIAVYLGYKNKNDRGPSFYLLEAGTATGDAKMIYYSPSMAPITKVTSGYLPTPFVTMSNTYSGGISMQAAPNEDEPDTLVVNSQQAGDKDSYITVTVKYQRSPTMELALPHELTADAGARVALIADTMKVSAEDLQNVLSSLGKDLFWKQYPHYETGAAPAQSAAPLPAPR